MSRKFFMVILVLFGCMLFYQPVLFAAEPEQMSEGPHYDSLRGELTIPGVTVDELGGCYDVVMKQRGHSNNWEVNFATPSENCPDVVVQEPTQDETPTE